MYGKDCEAKSSYFLHEVKVNRQISPQPPLALPTQEMEEEFAVPLRPFEGALHFSQQIESALVREGLYVLDGCPLPVQGP